MAIKRLSDKDLNQLGKIVYTDYTEIVYQQGQAKIYLIPYLEQKTKVVVAYGVSDRPTAVCATETLSKAVQKLVSWGVDITNTYFHQDQGSVFKAYEYVRHIVINTKANISYSRVGTPGDNPEMESFFGRLKDDWKDAFFQAETRDEIIRLIDKAIVYYNDRRIHSNHRGKSPMQYLNELQKITKKH